jgi:DNA helicase II / ATP-dependent DNA helicase PcrA
MTYGGAMEDPILAGLNEEQRRAVTLVRGPVCILAGAGSGKTTTITRRIAYQVATETFQPSQILAVTFTEKAAGEMKQRLDRLGVQGVRASTFHSAAFAQLRTLSGAPVPQILPSKAASLRRIANTLPKPYRFRPAIDLASEIEWARNRRITTDDYAEGLEDHEPPIPADLMASVYRRYESGKRKAGLVDFEDLLESAIQMYEHDEAALSRFRAKYAAITVDEYQDVNLLQETLLQLWIGDREDLCAVGDDYQSIYGFTGATPTYLLGMPERFPGAHVVRLEHNYRSTPEVLEVANRLVPKLGGARKVLHAVRPSGARVQAEAFGSDSAEIEFIVRTIGRLNREGVPLDDMAILYRANFRSEDYAAALAAEGIAYQVRDTAFLGRAAARYLLKELTKQARNTAPAAVVRTVAERAGYLERPPDDLGEQEMTRQEDLARFIRLAQEFDVGIRTCGEFVSDLTARFTTEGEGRGVNLLTYHRAKGLEFEAAFLPRLEDGELPFKRARSPEAYAEERRLFYVGITRAKTHLAISWVTSGRRKPSPFVLEAGLARMARAAREESREVALDGDEDGRVAALKSWRLERSKREAVPAYVILHDATLIEIAQQNPRNVRELAGISGIGPAKLEKYGAEVLRVLGDSP